MEVYGTIVHNVRPRGPNGRRQGIGASGMRALIANEPAIYREAISAALRELRPGIEVFTAEPEDLEDEFLRLLPEFVVCSQPTKRAGSDASVWVELYPDGASHSVVRSIDGSRKTLFSMNFDELLSILDAI
jgi:hypothetical protein